MFVLAQWPTLYVRLTIATEWSLKVMIWIITGRSKSSYHNESNVKKSEGTQNCRFQSLTCSQAQQGYQLYLCIAIYRGYFATFNCTKNRSRLYASRWTFPRIPQSKESMQRMITDVLSGIVHPTNDKWSTFWTLWNVIVVSVIM